MYTPVISHPALEQLVKMEYLHLCLDETGIPKIKHITKNLELELVGQLKGLKVSVSDIRKIESRFILLIGSDDNLLEAVGAYIYCLNCITGGTSLSYHSFRGKSEDCLDRVLTLKDTFMNITAISQREFFKEGGYEGWRTYNVSSTGYPKVMEGDLLDHILQGRSVFLADLKYPESKLLERSGKRIRGIVTHWETCGIKKRGLLVVSAKSEEDLPEYFVRQFEIINLEPQRQASASARERNGVVSFNDQKNVFNINNCEYLCSDSKVYLLFKMLYENQHRRLSKQELLKGLSMGNDAESQLFNKKTALAKLIKDSHFIIDVKKSYSGKECGYLLMYKKSQS